MLMIGLQQVPPSVIRISPFFSYFFIILTIRFVMKMCISVSMSFRSNCCAIREMISN